MGDEPSNEPDEPPLWCLIFLLSIPLFIYYPFKTILFIIVFFCTKIGYSEDMHKRKVREERDRELGRRRK